MKRCQNYGIYIVIATARYWIGAEHYIEEIQPDYEITTDGTLIHRHGEQIYSCNLENEDTNQIIYDILERDDKTEITVAAGRQVLWNNKHISESENYIRQFIAIIRNRFLAKQTKLWQNFPIMKRH